MNKGKKKKRDFLFENFAQNENYYFRAAKKPNLGQFSFKSRGSSKSTRGGRSTTQPSSSSRAKTANNLGFMPVPQPRSFLSNVSGGAYF